MSTGEKTFSIGGVNKTKRNFEPAPAGDYDSKLLKTAEIKLAEPSVITKGPDKGKMSKPVYRVGVRFELLETSTDDSPRNKLVFHDLSCDLRKNKDGEMRPQAADQIKGLCDALGIAPDLKTIMYKPKGSTEAVEIIDPRALKKLIEDNADAVIRLHVKVQAGTKEYPEARNRITEFFEAGTGQTEEAGDGGLSEEEGTGELAEEGAEVTEEATEGGDDSSLEGLEGLEELEEPAAPAPKAAAKPAPKPASKPTAKPVAKGKPVAKKR